jgi:hypothetical protein
VVDFENDELYGTEIGVRKSAFDPILTFRNAELFTKYVSKKPLFIQRGLYDHRRFGFVAVEIGAQVSLDQANSKASFFNDNELIFESAADTNYEIIVDNDAPAHSEIITDANHYYKAVGLTLSEDSRIHFMSVADKETERAGPEAACFTAFLGESQL